MPGTKRYRTFSQYLKETFGERVHKVTLDAGFTCPNRDGTLATGGCIYCDHRGSGAPSIDRTQSVTEQLEAGMAAVRRRYKADKFIAYFQAFTNTYAPLATLRRLYDQALAKDGVVGLAVGTRPDCLPDEVLDLLEEYTRDYRVWLEIGLESAHDRTLELVNRGHDVACFADAVKRAQGRALSLGTKGGTKGRGLRLCAHVILGLPGETKEEMLETARTVAGLGLDEIKIHSLHVLRGTKLASMYRSGEVRLMTMEEYVGLVCDFLELLPPDMVIQRLMGEGAPDLLIAPDWSRQKMAVLEAIDEELERRDSHQGIKFERG